MSSVRDAYTAFVREHCFAPASHASPIIGAEIEFLPLNEETLAVHKLFGPGGTIELLRAHANRLGWREYLSSQGIPAFHTASGGSITFEPGGQIEYSSPPFPSASTLLRDLELHAAAIERIMCTREVLLHAAGIDPYNGIESVPLQLDSPRYSNMARYFAQIGPAGARMMRQTTALQISVSAGSDPLHRWRLLNRLAPVLTALFANSRRYERRDSGFASYRAQTWRETDPARTGVFPGDDAVDEYTDFALRAPDLLRTDVQGNFLPFSDHAPGNAEPAAFAAHLSTLFPEVRPRGYFELRSIDGRPRAEYSAPIALIAGIVFDVRAAAAALELLPASSEGLLGEAARCGPEMPSLGRILPELVDIALKGCSLLGDFITTADLDSAQQVLQARAGIR